MIGILEIILIIIPFGLLFVISIILSVFALRLRQITGEDSIIHLTTLFIFASLLFFSLLAAWLNINNLDTQYWFFSLGIFAFWAVLLEMGIFYLAVFVNPNRIFPSIRLYIPAIIGAASTLSLLRVLKNLGSNFQAYTLEFWELIIYIIAVLLFLLLEFILVRELYRNRRLFKDNASNLAFMDSVRHIITSGSLAVIFVFTSVVIWFFVKTTDLTTGNSYPLEFSLLIQNFEIIDWIVYLNIPILLAVFVFISIRMRKLNRVVKHIDINDIYNALM